MLRHGHRTARPDLQGFWNNQTYTPLERPDNVTKEFYTLEEAAALEQVRAQREGEQTVNASGNTPPVAKDDAAPTAVDTAVVIAVLGNDSDPETDPLSVTAVSQGASGTVAINGDNTVTYTPNLSFTGTDSFTYTIDDGNGNTDTATVTVYVGTAIEGGPGDDVIIGTSGNDVIFGLGGDDVLEGRSGNDTIYGDDGNDLLKGQGGSDTIIAEAGDDIRPSHGPRCMLFPPVCRSCDSGRRCTMRQPRPSP